MTRARLVSLSKFLSLMLRHQPHKFGLTLDAEGFAPLEDVLRALRAHAPEVTADELRAVVELVEPDKKRFTIVDQDIRANYGHSLDERIRHAAAIPPPILLHGTTEATARIILREGLSPMRRQYVHLTDDRALAMRVGARRGPPVLLTVDALVAHEAGVAFYRANESFWLADSVPAQWLRMASS
jgi:putative RNA 2'-phosphotransferase